MCVSDEEAAELLRYYQLLFTAERGRLTAYSSSKIVRKQGGNLAVFEARLNDDNDNDNDNPVIYQGSAFSNSSSLPIHLKHTFAPTVAHPEFGDVGVARGCQCANQTKPKLWVNFKNNGAAFSSKYRRIVLVSEMDCCGSCLTHTLTDMEGVYNLSALSGAPVNIIIVELKSGIVTCSKEKLH